MKLAAVQKVGRYAMVGASGWMSKIIKNLNLVFPDLDMWTFRADREEDTCVWLVARPPG